MSLKPSKPLSDKSGYPRGGRKKKIITRSRGFFKGMKSNTVHVKFPKRKKAWCWEQNTRLERMGMMFYENYPKGCVWNL